MIEDVRQDRPHERGGDVYFTNVGRDPTWTGRAMAEVWAHAHRGGLQPLAWRLGMFSLRDVLRELDSSRSLHDDYRVARPDQIWGCKFSVICLGDAIELDAFDPHTNVHRTLVPRRPE